MNPSSLLNISRFPLVQFKSLGTYIFNLPKAVLMIFVLNVSLYLLQVLLYLLNFDITDYLNLYYVGSTNFFPHQIIASNFVHDDSIDHLLSNMIFLLIFGPLVEKRLGTSVFIFLYLIGCICCSSFNLLHWEQEIAKSENYFNSFVSNSEEEKWISSVTRNCFLSGLAAKGASGAIACVLLIYLIIGVFEKTTLKISLSLFFGTAVMLIDLWPLLTNYPGQEFLNYGHLGGYFAGGVFSIYLWVCFFSKKSRLSFNDSAK